VNLNWLFAVLQKLCKASILVEKKFQRCVWRQEYINNSIFETERGETFFNNPRQPNTNKKRLKTSSTFDERLQGEQRDWLVDKFSNPQKRSRNSSMSQSTWRRR
jgi:hypothetical protein